MIIKINTLSLMCLLVLLVAVLNGCESMDVKDWFKGKIDKLKNKTNNLLGSHNEENPDTTDHNSRHHHNHNNHGHHHHQPKDENHNHHHKQEADRRSRFNPFKFLETNGYSLGKKSRQTLLTSAMKLKNGMESLPKDNIELKDMIKLFQRLHHLNVTGTLDNQTAAQMVAPRCGFPDIPDSIDDQAPRVASFKAYQIKWNKTDLTYRFVKYNKELGERGTRLAIHQAFQYWSQHSELNFREVCQVCPSDLVIDFNEHDHEDGNPFDGESGVLAHAYFPKDGRIHFDESEIFTESSQSGINLRIVAAHEIGHALGLEHSFVKDALMYPYYGGFIADFKLPEDDQMGIAALYGKRSSPLGPTTFSPTTAKSSLVPTKTTITTRKTTISQKLSSTTPGGSPKNIIPCNTPYEALFTSPKNNIWVLIDHDDLWLYNLTGRNWNRFSLYDVYPTIESAVRGGVKCSKNYTWFFKGKKVWAYHNYNLVSGFPKTVKDPIFPSNPWSAVNKNGKIYVLKGSFAYEFDTITLTVVNSHPGFLKKVFPGLPDWVETSIKYNGQHYMFKDKWVYKFDETTNKVLEGYPRIKYDAWFPCYRSIASHSLTLDETRL